MSGGRRPLMAGNWKMNGLMAAAAELDRIIAGATEIPTIDFLVCPPATLLATFAARARDTAVAIGAQDCRAERSGAFTGDLSAEMLKDAGASAVIVGHSERRAYHRESDADVRAKAMAAHRAGLWQSSALAKRGPSAMPAVRWRLSKGSLRVRCRMA